MRVHADAADAAELEERVDEVVVAGVEVETRLVDDPFRLRKVVVRLLDGLHCRDLRQFDDRFRLDVDGDTTGDVVDDDRPVALGRDRLEVLDDSTLRRLVVVRRHDEEAVDADLVRCAGQVDRMRSGVRARSGDHRRALAESVDRDAEELESLVVGEGRALPCGARDDDPVGAVLDQMLRKFAEAFVVDRAVLLEWRDDRSQNLAQHGH